MGTNMTPEDIHIDYIEADASAGENWATAPTYLLTDPERRDVIAWNEWREANPSQFCHPNIYMTFSNLSAADIAGADLRWVRMGASKMRGSNLTGANLYRANLYNSDLTGANLSGANLCSTELRFAFLTGANLDGAIWDDMTEWPDGFTPPILNG